MRKFNLDVTSKYGIEQIVFFMRHNKIESAEIRQIRMGEISMSFSGDLDAPKFLYSLKDRGDFYEKELYPSKEALLRSLSNAENV
jgi:hypothetical protein